MASYAPVHSVLDRMLSLTRSMDSADWESALPGIRFTDRNASWFPAIDTYETEGAFVVEMDVPGVHPENVEISFEQNTLTLKGTRQSPIKAPEKGELRVFMSERVGGTFSRAIRLPDYVDGEKIEARYNNGVLTVTVPKAAAAKPRKIAINVNAEKQISA